MTEIDLSVETGGSQVTTPVTSLRAAMANMTDEHQSLLPVVDENGVLVGVVTDGDIRRGLLRGVDLEDAVSLVLNKFPIVAGEEAEQHQIEALMHANNTICIPVVGKDGRFVRLAHLGRHLVPNCIPYMQGREQAYTAEAINGGWLAVGPFIERFEREIAEFTGASHAVALSNGTAALHLALHLKEVGPGDLVLMPSLTFAATANAAKYCGADPLFIDSDPQTMCIDVEKLRHFLETQCTSANGHLVERNTGRRIAAVVPVHLYGHPSDMDPLISLAQHYEIPIVEDGAEALGASYKNRQVGTLNDLCVLSFNGNKIITGGNGGMILTNSAETAARARYLASQAKDDPVEFIHGEVGFNYRMPNINAAIALAQAEHLAENLERKRTIAAGYEAALRGIEGADIWRGTNWAENSYWMSILKVNTDVFPGAIAELRRFLPEHGIEARPLWTPLHKLSCFATAPHPPAPVAEALYNSALCLPCSVGITDGEQALVHESLVKYFSLFRPQAT